MTVRSGEFARCTHCKFEGYVYGVAYSQGLHHGPSGGHSTQLYSWIKKYWRTWG
jgi:hypothetical protein